MHHSQRLGHIIKRLRQMAIDGVPASDILAFAASHSATEALLPHTYLSNAFGLRGPTAMAMPPPSSPEAEELWREVINRRRAEWEREPIPELMRIRDYLSFMQFAKEVGVFVIVCAANPSAGRWIGRRRVRGYDGRLPIPACQEHPYEGLLAANPNDPRIAVIQQAYGEIPSYEAYLGRLAAQGLRVLGDDLAYLIEDADGHRLHESYRLHSLYDAKTYEPVWNQKTGEHLRAAINRHLGDELVPFGPHDQWEFRNDQSVAGVAFGPQLPALQFGPDQDIRPVLTTAELSQMFGLKQRWADLYPHHPSKPDAK